MKNLRLTIQKDFGPLAIALALAVVAVYAQTSRGTVTGTVLDSTGAAIIGARMTLTGVDIAFSSPHPLTQPESTGSMEK